MKPYTIKELLAEIELSNNGYLFAPTNEQRIVARNNPDVVKHTYKDTIRKVTK